MWIQLAAPLGGVGRVQQRGERYVHVVGVSEEALAIGERQLEGLGDQVERFGGAVFCFGEARALRRWRVRGRTGPWLQGPQASTSTPR